MGKAIILRDCDFSNNNIGQISFKDIPLESISINGDSAITNIGTYTVTYSPINTTEKGVIWSIVSGSEYATIDENTGIVTVKDGALNNNVTIRCTSLVESSIYTEKTISVTKSAILIDNSIEITATTNLITAVLDYAATSQLEITVGQLGIITINIGDTTGNLQISTSLSQRTESLSVLPLSDTSYNYILNSSSIVIPAISENLITVTATNNSVSVSLAQNAVSALAISVGELGVINVAVGQSSGSLSFATSSSERTVNLSVLPSSDNTYSYVLSTSSVIIPAAISHNLLVVGPDSIVGDIRAGNYYVLDLDTMKQVVGTQVEVTDDYKEYIGPILWSILSGSALAEFSASSGTEGNVNVKSAAAGASVDLMVTVDGNTATKTITANYDETDLEIASFADLQAFANAINNKQESQLVASAVNGDGFRGKHIRLTQDIDFNNSAVEIGVIVTASNDSSNRYFAGWFDGAGYRMYNVGSPIATSTWVSSIFQATQGGCKISNFTVEGNVTIPTNPKKGNVIIGLAFNGVTTMSRIYNKVNVSGEGQYEGFFSAICAAEGYVGYVDFEDCVYCGTASGRQPIWGTAASHNYFRRNTFIGSFSNANDVRALGVTADESCIFENCLINAAVLGASYSTGYSLQKGNITVSNLLYVGINSGTTYKKYLFGGTEYTLNASNVYYEDTLSFNSYTYLTEKTTQEIKSGTLFVGNDAWIEKEGYYPMINNQFAVRAEILRRSKYGYNENQ